MLLTNSIGCISLKSQTNVIENQPTRQLQCLKSQLFKSCDEYCCMYMYYQQQMESYLQCIFPIHTLQNQNVLDIVIDASANFQLHLSDFLDYKFQLHCYIYVNNDPKININRLVSNLLFSLLSTICRLLFFLSCHDTNHIALIHPVKFQIKIKINCLD